MPCRRQFLKTTLGASTLVALAPTVPGFLARTARGAGPRRDARALVVVQLDGGNDGINTVVPYQDEGYARHRKELRLPERSLLKIDDRVGLHPSMGEAARLLEEGRLAIVQGVGYPNPSRSHFESMAIWHTARPDDRTRQGPGWLGRALDGGTRPADGASDAVFVGAGAPPIALWGRRTTATALSRPEDLRLPPGAMTAFDPPAGTEDGLAAFVHRSALDAYASADRLEKVIRAPDRGTRYPETGLAGRLRLIARLLKSGLGTRVFYTMQPGYDTHHLQLPYHATLLGELSGALRAFLDDLAAAGLAERVLVLCFSEFGRRVAENGSVGTDHGTAGPVFVAGPAVGAGLLGSPPSLIDLEGGDLKWSIEFRRVYATLLGSWLGLPSRKVLGGTFEPLPLLLG